MLQSDIKEHRLTNLRFTGGLKMPEHNFGIMQTAPEKGKRFDNYTPEKYSCISVDDDDIMPLLEKNSTRII